MAERETLQARQAALLLHGLPPAVRRQVVAKLDSAERARLNPLLDELAEMGVSQSLSQDLQQRLQDLSPPPQPAMPAPSARELTLQERLERLSAEEASRRLQACAPVTVAQLLRSAEWPWKAQVLGMMAEARRAEVLDHMHRESAALAPAVLATLHERLSEQPAPPAVSRAQPSSPAVDLAHAAGAGSKIGVGLRRLVKWMR